MNRNRGSRFPIVLLGHDPRITGKNNTPVSHGPCDARIMNQPTSSIVISNFRSSPQRFLSRDTVTRRHFFSTSQRKPTVDNRLRSRATLSIIVPLFLLATDAEELRFSWRQEQHTNYGEGFLSRECFSLSCSFSSLFVCWFSRE